MRVLVVNPDGLLAAMPTVEEYTSLNFDLNNVRVLGRIECPDERASVIYKERARVRVVVSGMPLPGDIPGEWLWISVVRGEVVLL